MNNGINFTNKENFICVKHYEIWNSVNQHSVPVGMILKAVPMTFQSFVCAQGNDVAVAEDGMGYAIESRFLNDVETYWVPSEEFHSHFTLLVKTEKTENMSMGEAIEALEAGKKVCRAGWNGARMFLFLVPGSTFKVSRPPLLGIYPEGTEINYQPHIDMKTAQDTVVPWLASQSDLLAKDWKVVE